MEANVTIAVIAVCGVVLSAVCVLSAGIFAYTASNKRLDKIDLSLENIRKELQVSLDNIRKDMQEFYRLIYKLEAKVDKE